MFRDCIADAGVLDVLDGGGEITNLPCCQLVAGDELARTEIADLDDFRRRARRHHADCHSFADETVTDPAEYDDAAVRIIERVEDQRLQGSLRVSCRGRNLSNNCFQNVFNADALFGRDQGSVFRLNTDDILDLLLDLLRHCAGQIDLIDHERRPGRAPEPGTHWRESVPEFPAWRPLQGSHRHRLPESGLPRS